MGNVNFTKKLQVEYGELFDSAQIVPSKRSMVENVVNRILENQSRYEKVVQGTTVPWQVVAAVHSLEASLNFKRHLHNGDPLTARTVQYPPNRPPASVGDPPFTWEESAYDALFRHMKWNGVSDWSLVRSLYQLEAYNGWGYRLYHPETLSPYLWSFTTQYVRGKYTGDGKWDPNAVSGQVGACAILRRMLERSLLSFDSTDQEPSLFPLKFSKTPTPYVDLLQNYLNMFPGIRLEVNSIPDEKTSEAFYIIHGDFLLGDPQKKNEEFLSKLLKSARMSRALPISFSVGKTKFGGLLQDHLNKMPGVFLRTDEIVGNLTCRAFHDVYGIWLPGSQT